MPKVMRCRLRITMMAIVATVSLSFVVYVVSRLLVNPPHWIKVEYTSEIDICCSLLNGVELEEVCGGVIHNSRGHPPINQSCTCADYFYCRLAVVTAISANHYKEAQDMIHSIQVNLPHTKIYIYDLGLTYSQRLSLLHHCFVEVRKFPFKNYPPHFHQLEKNDAWKPLIISEVAKEHEVVLYGDASMRVHKSVKENLLPLLLDFPFVAGPLGKYPVISVATPKTYQYLGLNLSRKQALEAMPVEIASTILCIWVNKLMRERFLNYWIDCAMHSECYSPDGYQRRVPCHSELIQHANYTGQYIGCLRCQSIMNILLYREFGGEVWRRIQHHDDLADVWSIQKYITQQYHSRAKYCYL